MWVLYVRNSSLCKDSSGKNISELKRCGHLFSTIQLTVPKMEICCSCTTIHISDCTWRNPVKAIGILCCDRFIRLITPVTSKFKLHGHVTRDWLLRKKLQKKKSHARSQGTDWHKEWNTFFWKETNARKIHQRHKWLCFFSKTVGLRKRVTREKSSDWHLRRRLPNPGLCYITQSHREEHGKLLLSRPQKKILKILSFGAKLQIAQNCTRTSAFFPLQRGADETLRQKFIHHSRNFSVFLCPWRKKSGASAIAAHYRGKRERGGGKRYCDGFNGEFGAIAQMWAGKKKGREFSAFFRQHFCAVPQNFAFYKWGWACFQCLQLGSSHAVNRNTTKGRRKRTGLTQKILYSYCPTRKFHWICVLVKTKTDAFLHWFQILTKTHRRKKR